MKPSPREISSPPCAPPIPRQRPHPNHDPIRLSSANETEIYFIEIEPVRVGGSRKLKVHHGSGSGTYHDLSDRVMITANPPAEGMIFDKWIGNTEPQYFEERDQWLPSTDYIEDVYDSTTFVTELDYVTRVAATYRKR